MKEKITEEILKSKPTLYKKFINLKRNEQIVLLWGGYFFTFTQIGEYYGVSRQRVQKIVRNMTGYRDYDKVIDRPNKKCKFHINNIKY